MISYMSSKRYELAKLVHDLAREVKERKKERENE